MNKGFSPFQKLGEETRTDGFWTDANGKNWPIYRKLVDLGAGPNATGKSVTYAGAGDVKADGHFYVWAAFTKAATAPVVTDGAALVTTLSLTQVTVTASGNLTTYNGYAVVEYCKAAD